jgi:Domain of unknown function (DUF4296)
MAICVVLLACNKQQEQPTIPREKMSEVLADIFIADAAISSGFGGMRDTMQAYYYEQVFQLHSITREQYQQNMAIYSKSLVEMDSLMTMAKRKLEVGH